MINFSQSGIGHFRKLVLAASFIGLVSLSSCNKDDSTDVKGNWTGVAQMGGAVRGGAISFKLGEIVYVGLGYNGSQTSTGRVYLKDFQSFNGGSWTRNAIPEFPGTPREGAVAFVLNNKVYIGLGYNRDQDTEVLDDFWQYDPGTTTWTPLTAKFPVPLYNSLAFVVNGKAFVGTGTDGSTWENTIWEFDEAGQSWNNSTTTSIPGKTREGAMVFVLDNQAYIIGGISNGSYELAFWRFSSEGRQWENITPTDDKDYFDEFKIVAQRKEAVTMVMDNYVYIATGGSATSSLSSCYQYDPSTQIWREMQAFEGVARKGAVAFVLKDQDGKEHGYLGTGYNGTSYFSDFWEFKPFEDYDADR